MATLLVIDTETTGLRPPIGVVEVAWVEMDSGLESIGEFSALVNPGLPIEPGAQAVHGICIDMVATAPPIGEVLIPWAGKPVILAAHNLPYDLRLVGPHLAVVGEVCTLALSRQYYPKAPNHKLTTMQAYLGLPEFTAHRALGDVQTTHRLLQRIVRDHGLVFDLIVQRQALPRMLLTMPFGKHKGDTITEVPPAYRRWLLESGNLDKDLRYTLTTLEHL